MTDEWDEIAYLLDMNRAPPGQGRTIRRPAGESGKAGGGAPCGATDAERFIGR